MKPGVPRGSQTEAPFMLNGRTTEASFLLVITPLLVMDMCASLASFLTT